MRLLEKLANLLESDVNFLNSLASAIGRYFDGEEVKKGPPQSRVDKTVYYKLGGLKVAGLTIYKDSSDSYGEFFVVSNKTPPSIPGLKWWCVRKMEIAPGVHRDICEIMKVTKDNYRALVKALPGLVKWIRINTSNLTQEVSTNEKIVGEVSRALWQKLEEIARELQPKASEDVRVSVEGTGEMRKLVLSRGGVPVLTIDVLPRRLDFELNPNTEISGFFSLEPFKRKGASLRKAVKNIRGALYYKPRKKWGNYEAGLTWEDSSRAYIDAPLVLDKVFVGR